MSAEIRPQAAERESEIARASNRACVSSSCLMTRSSSPNARHRRALCQAFFRGTSKIADEVDEISFCGWGPPLGQRLYAVLIQWL